MAALLKVLENAKMLVLRFATKEDAQRFKEFVLTYMEESGAGNGYGAYWVFANTDIAEEDLTHKCYTCAEHYPIAASLNRKLLSEMLAAILTARLAERTMAGADLKVEDHEGHIRFSCEKLPVRQRPSAGDMFRALKMTCSETAQRVGEGRVLRDNGETLDVISCWDEGKDGEPNPNATVVTVRADEVMKINDWQAEMRRT